ncbi:exonuclease domain-containing protein [Streptomyces sp. NPDC005551]|uniref:exonuclease domain-containing protein n=1 Tax=Streptomyces sp. NPDC005551 TaxID=3364725 RepID=UPI0036A94982
MATPWWNGEFAAFDTETTGKNPEEARIVTACLARVGADGTVKDSWEMLINPGVPIDPKATEVHGISDEMAADGLDPASALQGLVAALDGALTANIPLVIYNARFDLTTLDRDCRRNGIPTLEERTAGVLAPILDPYIMDKAVDTYRRGSRKLGDVCTLYGVSLEGWHNAAADAVAAAQLARTLIKRYRGLQIPLSTLHTAQQTWARQQANSFERYLRNKTGDAGVTIDGSWPMTPHPVPVTA